MNRRYLWVTFAVTGFFCSLLVLFALRPPAARLIWNASESAPVGLYHVVRGGDIRPGALVAIRPPASIGNFLAQRNYLPAGLPLLKRVAALRGARVCRSGVFVTVDGVDVARALPRDRAGRPLPVWHGCRIVGAHEIFLINAPPGSLDSRYFGPIPVAGLIGIAHPIVTRGGNSGQMRWQLRARQFTQPSTGQEKMP